MKKFITLSISLSSISLLIFFSILAFADGQTDAFYLRFTTPKQKNLIIGTSRAAQGLLPQVFEEKLNCDMFNYAFTVSHSPYGPIYMESIKKKLDQNVRNGIFIVAVDPWSISSTSVNPNDIHSFRENNLCLGNTGKVNINPNFQYLINNYSGRYAKIISPTNNKVLLHRNGWLEVTVEMDSISTANRINKKVADYHLKQERWHYSQTRVEYLIRIVSLLERHGSVYIVRLPVHDRIKEIEEVFMPNFEYKIGDAIALSHGFLDLTKTNDSYIYTDGNHLHKKSGTHVSGLVAKWIIKNPPKL